jgi:hypothetical protein
MAKKNNTEGGNKSSNNNSNKGNNSGAKNIGLGKQTQKVLVLEIDRVILKKTEIKNR